MDAYSAFPSKQVIKNAIKISREILYIKNNVLNAIQSIAKQDNIEKAKSVCEQRL